MTNWGESMRSGTTVTVVPAEWRWVIVVSLLMILAAFSPYLWMIFVGATDTQWQFMGILHSYQAGGIHLSAMTQGAQGDWLTHFLHTPEAHDGVFFDAVYTFLGQVSGAIGLPSITIFHVARAVASFFMYMALYQLAASIWMRLRTRRIFLVLVIVGGGFGWLLGPLTNDISYFDLSVPIAYPFQASLIDIHTPFTIGCMALIASVLIPVFRPGATDTPGVSNSGVWVFILSLVLMFVEPLALVPMIVTMILYVSYTAYRQRGLPVRESQWLLWFGVPALPMTVYYVALLTYNTVVSEVWFQLHDVPAPSLPVLILSLGFLFIISLPGLLRAVRSFEADGDRFMLLWFVVILVLLYLPTRVHLSFTIGIMIPVAYFATRSLEDFWFNYMARRWRFRVLVAFLPLVAASHLFVLYLPVRPILSGNLVHASGLLLQRDYGDAFDWLRLRVRDNDVVLASPNVGLWLPARTGSTVVYGHPRMTLEPTEKQRALNDWYASETVSEACFRLLDGDFSAYGSYQVRYVLVGPQERSLGAAGCVDSLEPRFVNGTVEIYEYVPALLTERVD